MKLETDVECPNCKTKIKIKIEEMVPGRSKLCPGCKSEIDFTGDDAREAQRAVNDLEKTLKNMFKN